MKKVLITGIYGSGASYLAEHLLNHQYEVIGLGRERENQTYQNISTIKEKIKLYNCDLNNISEIKDAFKKESDIDGIFHVASNADVKGSFDDPVSILQNNIISTANLLEVYKELTPNARLVLCSTSEVYGLVDEKDIPISESQKIRPASPYAVSKTTQDLLANTYYKSYGLDIVTTRMFTYLNPRRRNLFASSFAFQIAEIEKGLRKELTHGNLESIRTIIDVRDAMECYRLVYEKGVSGEVYNLGGKEVISVGDFLKVLINKSSHEINCRVDKNLLRPNDVTLQIPDISKFKKLTGWIPKFSTDESIEFLLKECRKQIA